jgi:hypothetical protein
MSIWRRKPLHERLAEEGGLVERPPPLDTTPNWGEVGIHGVSRPREWDAVAAADAPDLQADTVGFTALPDGTLLVEEDVEEGALTPLAEAVEAQLAAPYRAEAVRRGEGRWAVAARRIEVVRLPDDVQGEEIELSSHDGERTLVVDGAQVFGSIPELERLGEARHEGYVVHAERLDGGLWEVKLTPL